MESLHEISFRYSLDKNYEKTKCHDYIPAYTLLFDPIRGDVKHMLEIGIGSVENGQMGGVLHLGYKTGNSLKCWSEYFYNAKIYGIDIYQHNELNNERIRTFVADQSSTHNLQSVMDAIKSPLDIIIDDGSHDGQHQAFSFMYLNSFLSTKGIYIIEDIQPDNILKFQTLSIFPPEFRSYLNDNFTIQYFDTREKHNKTDDFMAVFKRK